MTTKFAGQNTGEFLVSEANGTLSREVGTLLSGEVVEDGRVLKFDNTGKLVPAEGTYDTNGSTEDIAGIAYGKCDASGGDAKCVYIARLAEVKRERITLHDLSEGDANNDDASAAVLGALEALNIVAR